MQPSAAKKVPKWFWPVGIGVALVLGLYLRSRSQASAAASSAPAAASSDVTGPPESYTSGDSYLDGEVDPTTGIPYAAEMLGSEYSSPYTASVDPNTGVPYATEIGNIEDTIANLNPTGAGTGTTSAAPVASTNGGTSPVAVQINTGQTAGSTSGKPNVSAKRAQIAAGSKQPWGDSVASIAKYFNVSQAQVKNLNPWIKKPNAIKAGAKVTI